MGRVKKMSEITIEVTDFCKRGCKYCSSNVKSERDDAIFISFETLIMFFRYNDWYDTIIISGGEPLYHPDIGDIIDLCREHSDNVVLYSNQISHIAYNAHVIDGIRVDCMLNVPNDISSVKILKRVCQGKERTRPDVTFSQNFTTDCNCSNKILLPNGIIKQNNCRKDIEGDEE
jgi:organic radical activating enzyme